MTKFGKIRSGDWLHIKSNATGMAISGTVLETIKGYVLYGRFQPMSTGEVNGVRIVGQEDIVYTEDRYEVVEHRPKHRYPEVGRRIEMWNGSSPYMGEVTKAIGFWDGERYSGVRYDDKDGRLCRVGWNSTECSEKLMHSIEWNYL